VPHLLWHGASGLSEGPPHLAASYDTQDYTEDLPYIWVLFTCRKFCVKRVNLCIFLFCESYFLRFKTIYRDFFLWHTVPNIICTCFILANWKCLRKISKIRLPRKIPDIQYSKTNLTKFDFLLSRDQTSRSRIWHMISENSSVGLLRLLWTMSNICKISDGTIVGKCFRNFLIPCYGSGCVWEWRNIPQMVRGFSCARNIQLEALNEL
jgi:hypothetical protein